MLPNHNVFVGDGKYPNDGGLSLQRLWEHWRWREIRGCPGRYTCRDKKAGEISPDTLMEDAGLLLWTNEQKQIIAEIPARKGRDPIRVLWFCDGGGLLSYKRPTIFVHTPNTESGLLRKLDAIGVPEEVLLT